MDIIYDDSVNPLALIFYGSAQITQAEVDETFGQVLTSARLTINPAPGTMGVYRVDGLAGIEAGPETVVTGVVHRKLVQYTRKSRYESMEFHTSGVVFRDLPQLVGALGSDEMRFFCARGMRAAIAPKTGPWEVMCTTCPHELECMMTVPELAL